MLSLRTSPGEPLVALSTASVFPDRVADAFEIAARLGYNGLEVMVSADAVSQDIEALRRLADYHGVPVLAIHAPCLLVTQRVWGYEPWGKLVRAKEAAQELGAKVVVVHPPFRWQREYAKDFAQGLARMAEETDIVFAVENMYPLRAGGAELAAYAPHWNPVLMDAPHVTLDLSHTATSGSDAYAMTEELGDRLAHVHMDAPHVTLDLSHTATSGSDAYAMTEELGDRLAHVHMADGTGVPNRDEHLVPGRGTQPCGPVLEKLGADGYSGMVVLEVNTRRATTREARLADLSEALDFTRRHLAAAPAGTAKNAQSGPTA